jgi:hypothetical protein
MTGVVQIVGVRLCVLLAIVQEAYLIVIIQVVQRVNDELVLVHSPTGAALGKEFLAVRDSWLL